MRKVKQWAQQGSRRKITLQGDETGTLNECVTCVRCPVWLQQYRRRVEGNAIQSTWGYAPKVTGSVCLWNVEHYHALKGRIWWSDTLLYRIFWKMNVRMDKNSNREASQEVISIIQRRENCWWLGRQCEKRLGYGFGCKSDRLFWWIGQNYMWQERINNDIKGLFFFWKISEWLCYQLR